MTINQARAPAAGRSAHVSPHLQRAGCQECEHVVWCPGVPCACTAAHPCGLQDIRSRYLAALRPAGSRQVCLELGQTWMESGVSEDAVSGHIQARCRAVRACLTFKLCAGVSMFSWRFQMVPVLALLCVCARN